VRVAKALNRVMGLQRPRFRVPLSFPNSPYPDRVGQLRSHTFSETMRITTAGPSWRGRVLVSMLRSQSADSASRAPWLLRVGWRGQGESLPDWISAMREGTWNVEAGTATLGKWRVERTVPQIRMTVSDAADSRFGAADRGSPAGDAEGDPRSHPRHRYLQLDPTNVVALQSQLVLWTRLGRYDPALLEVCSRSASSSKRSRSSSPTSDLPVHSATMRAYRRATARAPPDRRTAGLPARAAAPGRSARRGFLAQKPATPAQRAPSWRLRRERPASLTAFEDRAVVSWTSGRWNDERNVTRMLAILQRRGEVVIAGRSRGRKLWTLAQGWLPKAVPLPGPALEREATLRALRATGRVDVEAAALALAFSGT